MKCTDYYNTMKDLKRQAIKELCKAVKAHEGYYAWIDENDTVTDDAPVVAVLLDSGTTDLTIRAVKLEWLSDEIWYIVGEDEYGNTFNINDPVLDFPSPSQIQAITEAIPETDLVKDVTLN